MDKNYYTLKEIILGLRKEQKILNEKLKLLNEYVKSVDEKNFENGGFGLNYLAELKYTYYIKENLLLRLNDLMNLNFDDAIYGTLLAEEIKKDSKGTYFINDNFKIDNYDGNFALKVEEIKNMPFVQNLIGSKKYINDNLLLNFLYTNFYNKKRFWEEYLSFMADKDEVAILNFSFSKNYHDYITEVLNYRFSKDLFSPYIKKVIEESSDAKKDIIVPKDKIYVPKARFYLKDEIDSFVLKRKR